MAYQRLHQLNGNACPCISTGTNDEALLIENSRCSSSNSDKSEEQNKTFRHTSQFQRCKLLGVKDMPAYLQFNRYIVKGYRPLASWWGCAKSLLGLHNETVNILTHGIPLAYIIINSPDLLPWAEIEIPFLPYFHVMACMSPWIGSIIYHLFMNHASGEGFYNTLLRVDLLGIWFTQTFGALTTIYASTYCLPKPSHQILFAFYFALSLFALHKVLVAISPYERLFSFALQLLPRTAFLALRLSPYGGGDPRAKIDAVMQDLLAIIGGAISVARIPEKWLPGKLDYLGNSHHIMHILVVLATIHMHNAAKLDLLWISQGETHCCGNFQYV